MMCIDGHTFDETLLTGGWVIDAGCRGFEFSNYFYSKEFFKTEGSVLSIDIEDLSLQGVNRCDRFKQAALSHKSGETEAYLFGNGTANFVKGVNGEPGSTEDRPVQKITVPCITLQDIYKEIGTNIDLLKMDIECSEYEILESIEPIPKQISVEFHEHVNRNLHNKYIDRIMDHLCKDYNCTLHIREWPRYHYMDCLFVRKDLL